MIRSFGGKTYEGLEWTLFASELKEAPTVGSEVTFVLAGVKYRGIVEWVQKEKS